MSNCDSLGWAVKKGDMELVQELVGRISDKTPFDVKAAAQTAIRMGRMDLFDALQLNNDMLMDLSAWHDHQKCGSDCFMPHMLDRVEYSTVKQSYQQSRLIIKAIEMNRHDLAMNWINLLIDDQENWKIVNTSIECGWDDGVFTLYDKSGLNLDNQNLIENVVKHDRVAVWRNLWGRGANCAQKIVAFKKACAHQSIAMMDELWEAVTQGDQNEDEECDVPVFNLEYIFDQACRDNQDITIECFLNKNILDDRFPIWFMDSLLRNNLSGHMYSLFMKLTPHLKQQAFEQRNNIHIYQSKEDALIFFNQLMDIEAKDIDLSQRRKEQETAAFYALNWWNTWAQEGNLDAIKQWLPMCSQCMQGDGVMIAAQHGQLEVVKFLMSHGDPDDFACPLVKAAEHGHLEVVEFLLTQPPSQQDIDMAINTAVDCDQLNVVARLFHLTSSDNRLALLSRSLSHGHHQIVDFLLDQKCVFSSDEREWMIGCEWARTLKDDTLIPKIAHLIPHHPHNGVIFGRCVWVGLQKSAQSLLNKFDHHTVSFHELMNKMCSAGDLGMVRFLAPYVNFDHQLHDNVGMAIKNSHWAVLEELIDRCTSKTHVSDLLWHVTQSDAPEPTITHMAHIIVARCDMSSVYPSILKAAVVKNMSSLIDLLYPHFTQEQWKGVVQRVRMEGKTATHWYQLYVMQRYDQALKRQDIAQAVDRLGEANKRRVM